MKALTFQQPWASITACGVKDVENRSWRPKENPGKILIHTGTRYKKLDYQGLLPYEMLLPIRNMMNRGFIEDFSEMPTNCIVGVAEIANITKDNKNVWADERCEWKFELTNCHLFKTPIKDIKGKLNFFDVPEVDESNLPETIDIQPIVRVGEKLIVPVHEDFFTLDGGISSMEECIFQQHLLPDNDTLYCDENGALLPTSILEFVSGDNYSALFEVVDMGIETEMNEAGKPIIDELFDGGFIYNETINYELGKML